MKAQLEALFSSSICKTGNNCIIHINRCEIFAKIRECNVEVFLCAVVVCHLNGEITNIRTYKRDDEKGTPTHFPCFGS